jgi:uncharacterized phiE125 gp8 family phage protein
MSLRVITQPTAHPVSIDEIKDWLRIDGVDDEPDLFALRAAAEQSVENAMNRPLMTQTWELVLDAFPAERIEIPMPPLQSVTSVKYLDVDGNEQTWASGEYVVSRDYATAPRPPDAERGIIEEAAGFSFPAVKDVSEAVIVRFVCGYGDDPNDVPELIRMELRRHLAFKYENREGDVKVPAIPLADYKDWQF